MIILLSKRPSAPSSGFPLVTVWITELSLDQVTVSPMFTVTSDGKKHEPDSAQLGCAASFGMVTAVSPKTFVIFAMNKMAKSAKNGSVTHRENLLHDEHELHEFFMNKVI